VGNLSGELYDINLASTRKALALGGSLADKVVDNQAENEDLRLGTGFGLITDLISRPDGLYVLNLDGDLYRVATLGVPGPAMASSLDSTAVPEPTGLLLVAMSGMALLRRVRCANRASCKN
jgi:hypothetical protein